MAEDFVFILGILLSPFSWLTAGSLSLAASAGAANDGRRAVALASLCSVRAIVCELFSIENRHGMPCRAALERALYNGAREKAQLPSRFLVSLCHRRRASPVARR
ncbi:hypothetical protein [Mesorhizobium xinjiangense]|uniref:hypothetical protein n=1 Tax=Mesorhizobium xinjiangense TaxID=2678685 RepID=UPI0012EDCCEC|nr:hypothetical protein [Mesorhizobium xinjiangense]